MNSQGNEEMSQSNSKTLSSYNTDTQKFSQDHSSQSLNQPVQDSMSNVFGNRPNVFANFNRKVDQRESDDEEFSNNATDEDEEDEEDFADLVEDEDGQGFDLEDYLKNRDKL